MDNTKPTVSIEDKEYLVSNCSDKYTAHGIDICMIQTEPCKRAVEQRRCPKLDLWR